MFDHLGFQRWPFTVVPEPENCDFIADRKQLREDIEKLLRNLSRQNTSSIHPIWSWFGAGKTHALHYISFRASQLQKEGKSKLRTIYTEFPRNPSSFIDVYKSFAFKLNKEQLVEMYLEIYTSPNSEKSEQKLRNFYPDLLNALNSLAIGESADQEIVMRWLRAEPVKISDCRKVGISKKISTSEESSRLLNALVRVFSISSNPENQNNSRLIWLIDELQRIDRVSPRIQDEINTGLHSTFNSSPSGLSLILSFSGKPGKTLPAWLSPELKDRIGRTKVMILPPLKMDDALKFIRDVLANARAPRYSNIDVYFPFTEESCRHIIQDIEEKDELKPRAIMQSFNAVLAEADPKIENNEMDVITPGFAKNILSDLIQLD